MPEGCPVMVVLVQVIALLAALALTTGDDHTRAPVAAPVAYDVFLPSGG